MRPESLTDQLFNHHPQSGAGAVAPSSNRPQLASRACEFFTASISLETGAEAPLPISKATTKDNVPCVPLLVCSRKQSEASKSANGAITSAALYRARCSGSEATMDTRGRACARASPTSLNASRERGAAAFVVVRQLRTEPKAAVTEEEPPPHARLTQPPRNYTGAMDDDICTVTIPGVAGLIRRRPAPFTTIPGIANANSTGVDIQWRWLVCELPGADAPGESVSFERRAAPRGTRSAI
ncbi:Protein of unknown function [Gryllus bimaculatus]|nr:Protein of unknown function [Gryllus bimaculatus]